MPGTRRDRAAAPALAQRLQAAAETPAPIKFKEAAPPPPAHLFPTDGVSARSLGYPTDAEVQAGRQDLLGRVLGERYPGGGGERQAARMAAAERPPYYRRADAQTAPGEPPAYDLPPEVEVELRRPFTACAEPSEEVWAEASTRPMCELLAHAGFNALRVETAQSCRAMAYALLTGRELAP